jgi:hypothetical protein
MGFDITNLYVSRNRRNENRAAVRANEAARIEERRRQIDGISAQSIRDEETAPLRDAQAEFEQSFSTLAEQQHATIFTQPDPYGVFEPLPPGYDRVNAQTIKEHDQLNYELFEKARPQYFECDQNIATMRKYFAANGRKDRLTARTFIAAYDRLNDLGFMLTGAQIVENVQQAEQQRLAQQRAAAPARTVWDINEVYTGKNRATDKFEGWDPYGSGERVKLTAKQIDKLSMDEYKTFSRATVQQKPDWARIDDREQDFVAEQFTKLWTRNSREENNAQ